MITLYAQRLTRNHILKTVFRKFNTSNKCYSEPRWVYRRGPLPAPAYIQRNATIIGALMWYWVIYHCITQYDHIIGEFPYPDPSKWTDKELGIPPLDED